ncbi:MAG: hypothetical protein PHY13_00935 [Clostridia bacterium]|nr:hypothetical protein [Clostridia bacterium]
MIQRDFNNRSYRNVIVSDLTKVRAGMRCNYICVVVDLYNREIIGYRELTRIPDSCSKHSQWSKGTCQTYRYSILQR